MLWSISKDSCCLPLSSDRPWPIWVCQQGTERVKENLLWHKISRVERHYQPGMAQLFKTSAILAVCFGLKSPGPKSINFKKPVVIGFLDSCVLPGQCVLQLL